MRPRDARCLNDLLKMRTLFFPRDPERWGVLNGEEDVSLHPPHGEGFVIPREEFNAIVDWYMREQKPRRTKAA